MGEWVERLVRQTADLVAIRSTSDRPDQLGRALEFVLDQVGDGFTVRRFTSRGRPSALVHPPRAGDDFRVILNAHLDVVPGRPDQFAARREGDRLHGRGTHDMKTAALVLAGTFRELANDLPYPIALQLVTDEEVGGFDGTAHQVAAGVRGRFVLIGEQSALRVVNESKGLAHVTLRAGGRAAHAAYPWLGENALVRLMAGVGRLLARHPVPAGEAWATTVNVAGVATTNRAVNQVPAEATAALDIRFPPEDGDFAGRTAAEIAAHLAEITGTAVTVDALGAPHRAEPGHPDVVRLRAAARAAGYSGELLRKHGAADGRHYYAEGVPAVIFGPGGNGQHGPDEYVDIASLTPYRNALITFLRDLPA